MISIIVHLPLRGYQLRCYFSVNTIRQIKGNRCPNVEVFLDRQIGIEPLVIDWAKEEAKMARIVRDIHVYC